MTTTPLDLKSLKCVAEAATPGKRDGLDLRSMFAHPFGVYTPPTEADLIFLKTFDREVVLELLSRLERAEAANRENNDVCPACATEFEGGTFKKCGGRLISEVTQLRSQVERMRTELDAYKMLSEARAEMLMAYRTGKLVKESTFEKLARGERLLSSLPEPERGGEG